MLIACTAGSLRELLAVDAIVIEEGTEKEEEVMFFSRVIIWLIILSIE